MPQDPIDYATSTTASARPKRVVGLSPVVLAGAMIAVSILCAALLLRTSSGRYQAVQRANNVIFVIDTATGRAWENAPGNRWSELPTLPTSP
jgi:hypothetical protein